MENNGSFDGAVRIQEEPSEVSLIDDDQNVIDKSPDTNNSQLSQVRQDNNSTYRLQKCDENRETELDEMEIGSEFVDVKPDLNSLAVKKIEGDANELEMQIDSVFVEQNEIRTNTADLVHNDDQPSLSFNLEHDTKNEYPQNLQSSVKRRHSDSDVPTSNWSPWDPRPSTSSPNSMPRRQTASRHRPRSAQDKRYPCNVCDKSYTRNSYLTRHMLTHSGDRAYHCNVCDRSFTRKDIFTQHMLTHSEDKPFKCPECKYETIRKYTLNRHMKTHSRDSISGSSSGVNPAEPARQELPEAPRPARFESSSSGYETIRFPGHIAPQVDQDEVSPPDHDDKTIASTYHPNL